jgi:hypothetical protein
LHRVGLSQALPPALGADAGEHVVLTNGPPGRISAGMFGASHSTEYRPVQPTLVVEIRAEASVLAFTSRLRPAVYRLRLDLDPADIEPSDLTEN